ncbi:MAG: hypothetical protein ABH986_05610 [archaeon]
MPQKLMKGKTLRVTLDSDDLKHLEFEKREDIINKWINWEIDDIKLKAEMNSYIGLCLLSVLGGFFVFNWFFLFLIFFFPKVLNMQFVYGDSSSDKKRWKKKVVTRIDGFDIAKGG